MSEEQNDYSGAEWSYLYDSAELDDSAQVLTLEPSAGELLDIIKRADVLDIKGFQVCFTLKRDQGSRVIHVTGEFEADVTQACVVSLEPVCEKVADSFDAWYADLNAAVSLKKEKHLRKYSKGLKDVPVLDEQDDPEPMIDGKIDLGELAVQYLCLSLNPYPHKEGVAFDGPAVEGDKSSDIPEDRKNPFAALKNWKDKLS